MLKNFLLILFSAIILVVLFSEQVVAQSCKTRIFIDQAGRTVKVAESPKRVVSLAPSITEIVYDLNCEDRLKGVTTFSDFPEDAKNLTKVGSYVNLDLEKIVSLQPDLCIAVKDGNPMAIISRLEALDIPVYAVNPRSIETVITSVGEIGALLGASKKAEQLVGGMRSRIRRVETIISTVDYYPRVFFQIGISPIVSAGSDTFMHELIVKAGGINLAGDYKSYPRFSTEEVLVASPDIIIISSMAREKVFEKVKAKWQQWPSIPAVKTDRIFLVDSNVFDRPTPRLIDALEILVRLIHPELGFDGLVKSPSAALRSQ